MNLYCAETVTKLLDKDTSTNLDVFTCLIIPAVSTRDAKNIASTYNILTTTAVDKINNKNLNKYEIAEPQEFSEYGPSGKDGTYGQVKELSERNEDIFGSGHQLNFVTFTKLSKGIYKINL